MSEAQDVDRIPQKLAEELRLRRPGYDRIRYLMQEYNALLRSLGVSDALGPIPNKLIPAADLIESYVRPMFIALGWSVEDELAKLARTAVSTSAQADLVLRYQDLSVPVEVQVRSISSEVNGGQALRLAWNMGSSWAIVTNFQTIRILEAERPTVVLETGPWSYIADDSEEHDLLAAQVFHERLVRPLSEGPPSPEPKEQAQAEAPERIGDSRAIEPLITALRDPDAEVRRAAVEALGRSSDLEAMFLLRESLQDENARVRQAAVGVLGRSGDPEVMFLLRESLRDEEAGVRQVAVEALGRSGDLEVMSLLRESLRDRNAGVRRAAVEALGRLGAPEALPDLIEGLRGPDAEVRQAAAEALGRLGRADDLLVLARDGVLDPLEALAAARAIEDDGARAEALEGLTPHLPEELREQVLEEARVAAKAPSVAPERFERIEIATRALADTPSEVDLLGFSDYAEALADFIRNERTKKPLTIGIDAAWGMGKTTLMLMIRDQLTGREEEGKRRRSFPTVWFNAWKYDQEESLWAALALEILTQIRRQFNWWKRAKLWMKLNYRRLDRALVSRSVLKLLVYVVTIYLLGVVVFGVIALWLGTELLGKYIGTVGVLGFITALYAAGKEIYDSITGPFDLKLARYVREPNYKERVGFLAQFEEDFKGVIDVVTEGGKWPLIVFIDDLDRCAPPKPAEIIEAINILLDAEHCVFVIAMDAQAVAGSIEAKYKDLQEYLDDTDDPGGLTLGQRFLEKIIQINFRIPRADPQVVESFIDANLDAAKGELPPRPLKEERTEAEQLIEAEQRAGKSLDEATRAVQASRPDIPQEVVAEARQEVFAKSFDDSEDVRHAIHKAAPYLGLNPRKIKRFINFFRLQALIANRRGLLETGVIRLDILAKWVIIAMRWPDVIEAMMTNRHFLTSLKQAHETREELRQIQSEGQPFSSDGERPEVIEARLNVLLTNPRKKRLIDASDLINLLGDMTGADTEVSPYYLYLAQITIERSRPTPPDFLRQFPVVENGMREER
jgi:HEAT repeat protein